MDATWVTVYPAAWSSALPTSHRPSAGTATTSAYVCVRVRVYVGVGVGVGVGVSVRVQMLFHCTNSALAWSCAGS